MPHPFSLDVKLQKACGIDLHKDSIKACYMGIDIATQLKEFGTTTSELRKLCQDLISHGIFDVVIESTGIYWIPLYDLLTHQGVKVFIANPLRVKQIPGKKTDSADSEWLCKLLLNGLVYRSFIPNTTLRQLRQLNRQRYFYICHLSQVKNRILKVLETANLKLRSVLSNINTKSARKIVQALADGVTDIKVLQTYCLRKAAKKAALLPDALDGTLTANDRALLQLHLADWQYYDKQVLQLENAMSVIIKEHYAPTISELLLIPGIGQQSACTIVAEVGHTLESFPTADHFTSWAGLAPGNRQSANSWYAQHTTKGNKYFRTILIQVAWAAVRTKNGYWQAHFQYLRKRLPAKKAIVAIARKLAKLIYRVIKEHYQYEEKGASYFTERLNRFRPHTRSSSVAG